MQLPDASEQPPGRRTLPVLACALIALQLIGCGGNHRNHTGYELYLWSWQRTEDLSFINPEQTKLALWIATITLNDKIMQTDVRLNPVRYPKGTELVAVVRIEAPGNFDHSVTGMLAAEIESLVTPLGADELQLDFDATPSQRGFYRELLNRVRAALPEHRLSMTALASWCFGDAWVDALPVDAVVPMYYRMGNDSSQIGQYLASDRQIPARICRDNAGYSLDEPGVPMKRAPRIFIFNAERWNEGTLDEIRQKLDSVFNR